MNKKGQIVFVHGGDSFLTKEAFYEYLRADEYEPHPEPYQRWRDDISAKLESQGYEWLFMAMPNKQNADYGAWKIWFEKVVPFVEADNDTQVIGHSLGACFFLRYFSENPAPFTVNKLHLVALALREDGVDGGLGSFAADIAKVPSIAEKVGELHLWHSTDDPVCPFTHSEEVAAAVPGAILHTLSERGHIIQPEFPELLTELQK
jgi:predicted alpha/beta hydrolase family esterase